MSTSVELGKGTAAEGIELAIQSTSTLKSKYTISKVDKENTFKLGEIEGAVNVLKELDSKAENFKAKDGESFDELAKYVTDELLPLLEKKDGKAKSALFRFNTKLAYLTFLGGNAVSVLDFYTLPILKETVSKWTPQEQGQCSNITRWFNHIQNLPTIELKEKLNLIEDMPPAPKKEKKGGADNSNKDNNGKGEKGKKQKQKQQKPAAVDKPVDVSRCNFIVGKIVSVEKHPNADSLYIEQIDCGEAEPRTIVSGLVKFYKAEEMKDRKVIVFANLKPSNLKSVKSFGMVLCGSNDEHTKVELLEPPSDAKPGDRLTAEGFDGEPDKQIDPKKKTCIWPEIQKELKVNGDGEATYKGVALKVAGGPVKTKALKDVPIG